MKVPKELVGCSVRRLSFGFQVRVELVDELGAEPGDELDDELEDEPRVEAELVVETRFRLRDAGGRGHDLRPGTGIALAPVLALHERTVTGVGLRSGTLQLTFDDGAELLVGPDPARESWWLTGHGVDPILVGPGEAN